MKLKVGMYVRTDNGIIGKIYEKIGDMFTYKDSNRDYITYGLLHSEIIKASYNIIDLIEVGDYVNGLPVIFVEEDRVDIGQAEDYFWLKNQHIKSIVTKEQMKQMEYKV